MSNRPFNKSKSQVVNQRVGELKDLKTQNCQCDCAMTAGKLYTRLDDIEKETIEPTQEEVKEIKVNYITMKDEIIRLYLLIIVFGLGIMWVLIVILIEIHKLY